MELFRGTTTTEFLNTPSVLTPSQFRQHWMRPIIRKGNDSSFFSACRRLPSSSPIRRTGVLCWDECHATLASCGSYPSSGVGVYRVIGRPQENQGIGIVVVNSSNFLFSVTDSQPPSSITVSSSSSIPDCFNAPSQTLPARLGRAYSMHPPIYYSSQYDAGRRLHAMPCDEWTV